MQKILEQSNTLPSAVLCVTDMVAIGAMRAIHRHGLQPGKDISLIGYDGIPVGAYTIPALTTMTQPLHEAGEQLGSMLLDVIDGVEPESRQVLVKSKLVQRDSDARFELPVSA